MTHYTDKIILVTGGANGIGRATVERLLDQGATVAFTDISVEGGELAASELRKRGEVIFIQADATSERDAESTVQKVVQRWGRLDVAINNVGGLGVADRLDANLHESTLEGWSSTLASSLTSTFLAMKYEVIQMLSQGHGVIANNASMAGIRVSPDASAGYAAAKAGVVHLTKYAALRYAGANIRVNAVAPGATATASMRQVFTNDELDALASRFQPMGRMLETHEIADAFVWVCSAQATGVTGLVIPVDGGWAAR